MLTLAQVIQALTGNETPWGGAQGLSGVVIDSRRAVPGCLFVALQGEQEHGHAFVTEAFKQGAIAAIVEADLALDCQHLDLRKSPGVPAEGPALPV